MPLPTMSAEEIFATILKSNLVNIVVEGADDIIIYRRIEAEINSSIQVPVSLLPAGGRATLLRVYELVRDSGSDAKVLFVCDQDLWVLFGQPEQYVDNRIITTDGYSVENDMFRDFDPTLLMDASERAQFSEEMRVFSEWYCYQIAKHEISGDANIACNVTRVLSEPLELDASVPPIKIDEWRTTILANPMRLMRGKSILALVVRRLSHSSRTVKHSGRSLLEHAAVARGGHYQRLVNSLTLGVFRL